MFLTLLIMLLIVEAGHTIKILKFQSNTEGAYSTEHWAQFKGNLPHLKAFTVCHWERLRFFSVRETPIWSFCYKNQDVFADHHCTQFWYYRDSGSGGRYVIASGGFGDNSYGGKDFKSMDNTKASTFRSLDETIQTSVMESNLLEFSKFGWDE